MASPFILVTQTAPMYVNSPGDCMLVIGGSLRKQIAAITWSLGYGGAGVVVTNYPVYSRVLLFDGGIPIGASINNVTFQFSNVGYTLSGTGQAVSNDGTPTGVLAYGGALRFDADVVATPNGSGINGQFQFPADADDGFITQSGSIVVVLTAARHADNTYAAGVVGKLSVQYREVSVDATQSRTYAYTPVSKPLQ